MKNYMLSNFRKGKRIKKVTLFPNFLLKLKGKLDAKKGVTVVESFVNKMKERCKANENNEVLKAEKILFLSRKEGAGLLASIKNNRDILQKIPDERIENSAPDIRANRRNTERSLSASSGINDACEKLTSINEFIIDINTCLQQRIMKTRNLCSAKINTYLSGAFEVGADYKEDLSYDDTAAMRYIEKHSVCDNAIKTAVDSVYEGGGSNEMV